MSPLLLVALLPSAPAPQPRPVDITPGRYEITFDRMDGYTIGTYAYDLSPDGSQTWSGLHNGSKHVGSYSWDRVARVLQLVDVFDDRIDCWTLTFAGPDCGTWGTQHGGKGTFSIRRVHR